VIAKEERAVDLIIEGHPAELEWLRRQIEAEVGRDAQLEAVPSQESDKLSEPIIISLIVALGGPVVVTSVAGIIKRRYQHKEEMRKLDVQLRESEMQHEFEMTELKLKVRDGDQEREIVEDDLENLAA
jgi:hypothetical protein